MEPKEITIDSETNVEVASFDYRTGIHYARENGLKQTTEFRDVFAGTHFIVCCGDVMVLTNSSQWPTLKRRPI